MGNNPSRPGGPGTRAWTLQDRPRTQNRSFSTRGRRGKYDRDDYFDEAGERGEYPRHLGEYGPGVFPHAGAGQMPMAGQGYYGNPQFVTPNRQQPLLFPQPYVQPGVNPVIPGMMNGAIPTTGNPFPGPPMNMAASPSIPGVPPGGTPMAGEPPVIPPIPSSRRGRMGTPYHAPVTPYESSPSEESVGDTLTSSARERLQPPLAPGQYGPHDQARDRTRTPAPALRRPGERHRRVESSPVFGRERSPMYGHDEDEDGYGGERVIPPHSTGGAFGGGLYAHQFPPGFVPMDTGMMGLGAGAGMGMGMQQGMGMQPPPGPEPVRPRPFDPLPRSHNPLPPPPKHLLENSPYARIIRELKKPIDVDAILTGAPAVHTVGAVNVGPAHHHQQQAHQHHQGTRSSKEKKRKGLFRSLSARLGGGRKSEEREREREFEREQEQGPGMQTMVGGQSTTVYPMVRHLPDGTTELIYSPPGMPFMAANGMPLAGAGAMPMPAFMPGPAPAQSPAPMSVNGNPGVVIPPGTVFPPGPAPTPNPGRMPSPNPGRMPSPNPGRMPSPSPSRVLSPNPARMPSPRRTTTPVPAPPPPPKIKLDWNSELRGLLHVSPHSVFHGHRKYPTALHLHEALKFLPHFPDGAELIRGCGTPEEAVAVASGMRDRWRPDWERVRLALMVEVLYEKMLQHPDLRRMLLGTQNADLVFSDPDTTWGDGQIGQGLNLLGHALMRVRTRLREEGVD